MSRVPRTVRRLLADVVDGCCAAWASPRRFALGAAGAAGAALAIVAAGVAGVEAEASIADEFQRLEPTRVVVTSTRSEPTTDVFPASLTRRLATLPGVRHVGVVISLGPATVRSPFGDSSEDTAVFAADATVLAAIGVPGAPGSLAGRRSTVARVGVGLARRIGLPPIAATPSVQVGTTTYAVTGLVRQAPASPQMLNGVILNQCCGRAETSVSNAELIVSTNPRVTSVLADRLPALVDPGSPETVRVAVDSAPTSLRRGVERSVADAARLVAWAALVFGCLLIGLMRYAAVRERRREFGLRTALGARRGDIIAQVFAESVLVGTVGAAAGVLAGIGSSLVIAWHTGHAIGADPVVCFQALLSGVVAGAVAGVIPARAAAGVLPAEALRST